ncbi:MAG TPA: hypothetical protein DCY88_22570 [Cyanobacteria bacterium UBA11372]|nr:hypothetical protein [Cyanobacteria bacterium UBA11372]
MKMSYRGVAYEYEPPTIDMVEGEIGGKYRGQPWRCSYPRHIPVPQPALDLKYRGVAYSTYGKAQPGAIAQTGNPRKVCPELAETHLANIRRRLEHRLQVAKDSGDQKLIRMLEAESKQLVRSR